MKTLILMVLVVFVFALSAGAQNAKLIGVVRDSLSATPMPGTNVILHPLQVGTITDSDGSFIISDIPAGNYTLIVNYLGYREYQKPLTLTANQTLKLEILLAPKPIPAEEIVVFGTRARERTTPVVFDDMSADDIRQIHTVEDIPMMLTEFPNVFAYSDAGNGVGYSYLKVRGFDQKRIGVMINGIPLNDPEDHQVYWVDMPDFAESLQSIQFQRGVGSSLYGVSTFGGSLNMLTISQSANPGLEVFSNYGSYRSRKLGVKYNSPLIKGFQVHTRLSRLLSDGYRENSASEQWAYFIGLSRTGKKSFTLINVYGGKEITHAAWDASPESKLRENPRHNPIAYSNTIDNFSQPHFEFHHTYQLSAKSYWKNSLFYIRGKGYYEQLKNSRDLWEYGLWNNPDEKFADLIRQKWVVKNQYGWVSEFNIKHRKGELTLGTYMSLFNSNHWGEVDRLLSSDVGSVGPNFKYYQYFGDKYYLTGYLNELFQLTTRINLMVNLYYQKINYKFKHGTAGNFRGVYRHTFEVDYNFFNPRFGINYNLSPSWNVFGNFSIAHREPADNELYDIWQGPDDLGVAPLFKKSDTLYVNGQVDKIKWSDPVVKPEKLFDYELGLGYQTGTTRFKVNLFWMSFRNEIVPFSAVDEDGFPIRGNASRTVHRGIELSLSSRMGNHYSFSGNLSFNDNYFKKFKQYEFDWNSGKTVTVDYSGNKIAGFPDMITNWRFTYLNRGFSATLQVQGVGKQYLDNSGLSDRIIPPFAVLNARFRYRLKNLSGLNNLEFTLSLNNILNTRYFTAGYYDTWSQERYYWPAANFNWMTGIRVIL